MEIAANNGDAALYDELLGLSASTGYPDIKAESLLLTARFRDPELVTRTIDSIGNGNIRKQDSWNLLGTLLQNSDTGDLAWRYMQAKWTVLADQFTSGSGQQVVLSTGGFCSAEKRKEVISFFTTHKLDGAGLVLKQIGDSIDGCIRLRKAQEPNLKRWFAAQRQRPSSDH